MSTWTTPWAESPRVNYVAYTNQYGTEVVEGPFSLEEAAKVFTRRLLTVGNGIPAIIRKDGPVNRYQIATPAAWPWPVG